MGIYVWAAFTLAAIGASKERITVRFFDMVRMAVLTLIVSSGSDPARWLRVSRSHRS